MSVALPMTLASADTLIGRAQDRTGLSDFGPDGWREGLTRLVAAMSVHDFNEAARNRVEGRLIDVLATRLKIEDWLARHPELLEQEVKRPVFVIGLPRTATTALQAFLATDPQWRYLRGWEVADPTPPPDIATEQSDPRWLAERARSHDSGDLGQNLHIQEAGGPVDDAALLRFDFRNQELAWPVEPYQRWWRDCDLSTTYAYHARVLKLLQSKRPPDRWLVKAPWHNFHLDDLVGQYPDAVLVMCHRDPAKVVPSVCSLLKTLHKGAFGDAVMTPEAIGAFVLEHLSISIGKVMAFRRKHGDDRFIDVSHAGFNNDPFGTVDQVYGRLGLSLSDTARGGMEAWLERNRKGAHGEHRYTAEEFGLTTARIREKFAEYVERFQL